GRDETACARVEYGDVVVGDLPGAVAVDDADDLGVRIQMHQGRGERLRVPGRIADLGEAVGGGRRITEVVEDRLQLLCRSVHSGEFERLGGPERRQYRAGQIFVGLVDHIGLGTA